MAIKINDNGKFIPNWIISKNLSGYQLQMIETCDYVSIVKETEKAIQVMMSCEYGIVNMWCPKSVLTDEDEDEARYDAMLTKLDEAEGKYDNLVKVAKSVNSSIRNRLKVATIVAKMQEAGQFEVIVDLVKETKYGWKLA